MNPHAIIMPEQEISAAGDLLYVKAATAEALVLIRAWIGMAESEVSEQLAVKVYRSTADATGGTAVTPKPLRGSSAIASTAIRNPTGGIVEGDVVMDDGFNLLNGWLHIPVPDERVVIPAGGRLVLRLDDAPAAATKIRAGFIVGLIE